MKYYCINQEACGYCTHVLERNEDLETYGCPDCYSMVLPYLDHEKPNWIDSNPETPHEPLPTTTKAIHWKA